MRRVRRNIQTIDLAGKRGTRLMAQENVRLRLEARDGSATKEYRVDRGRIEVRNWQSRAAHDVAENSWQELNPEELSNHVERNTVVARWLERRIGWRRLLQACARDGPHQWRRGEEDYSAAEDHDESRAA